MFRTASFAVVFLAVWTQAALADFAEDQRWCNSPGTRSDIAIDACTRILLSGQFTGHDFVVTLTNRGNSYGRKGQMEFAISDYNKAIRLKPDHAPAFGNRGRIFGMTGLIDKAIADFNEAIRLRPSYLGAIADRGWAFYLKGDWDRAISDYSEAIRLKPKYGKVFGNRGLAYDKKGDQRQALQDFKKAYVLGARHPMLLQKLQEYKALQ